MKIVQTFWTGNQEGTAYLDIKAGWASAEYHWMSWALSCFLLRRHYDQVELFTDELGKSILIDLLNLPYTKVHIVFDESFQVREELFSLAKIWTYGIQDEPFIHVDGDVYIWKPFPDSFSRSGLIASNLEIDLFFNKEVLKAVHDCSFVIPQHLEGIFKEEHIYACNAGIFGGNDLTFIKKYCDVANNFISDNEKKFEQMKISDLNWLIEQISLFYLSKSEKVPVTYLIKNPVENPLYHDFWKFSEIPFVELVHPVGGCKKEGYVLDHLSKRLRLEFPYVYYSIVKQCQRQKLEMQNKFYSLVDVECPKEIYERQKLNFDHCGKAVQEQMIKKSFEKTFQRTLHLIRKSHNVTLNGFSDLCSFVEKQKIDDQTAALLEVFELENHKYAMLNNLIQSQEQEKEKMYFEDILRYEKTTRFFKKKFWMEQNIKLVDGVEFFYQTKDGKNNEYLITLSPNILNLDIVEVRHDGLDAVLLNRIRKGTIKSLAISLVDCFEERITIENKQYQQLLFDTIKRMAFENLVELE